MVLVSYKLNSAIERGTKPDALGRKPCHWTNTWKAAMVNASRAGKDAQTRCMTFLKCLTSVRIASTVSTSRRSCHSPRWHHVRWLGSPAVAWQASSLRTIMRSSHWRMSHGKVGSATWVVAHAHATTKPYWCSKRQSWPPTIQRGVEGSAIQVMLATRFHAPVDQNRTEIRGATAAMVVSDTCPGGSAHPDQRHSHTRHGPQPPQGQACVAHGALRLWATAWRPSSACGWHRGGVRASRCAGAAGPSGSV